MTHATMDPEAGTSQLRATLERGILKIRVPKAAVGRRKVIRIVPET